MVSKYGQHMMDSKIKIYENYIFANNHIIIILRNHCREYLTMMFKQYLFANILSNK